MIQTSWSKLSEKLKYGIKILLGQLVVELLIKTLFRTFWSTTQNHWYFDANSEFLRQFASRCFVFKTVLIILS